MYWTPLILWFILSVVVGIITYCEKDYKFGRFNLKIASLMFVFFFFSPLLLPLFWGLDIIERIKNVNQ